MNKFRSIAATILGGALICIALTACENFLKGQNTKEELDKIIAYNNAPSCKVLFKADPAMGEFLSNGEQSLKVGFGSEIQFAVAKEDYLFIGFEAVSKIDSNASRSEYVSFENLINDDEKGIYKISIKILKQSDDICIRPVCLELPCVTDYSPALGENAANTQIRISFNIPMDPQELTFDYGNISITSGTTNLNHLFNEPVLGSDEKTLTIIPKASELYDYIAESKIKVNVELADTITVTKTINEKKYVLALKQNENTNFSVVYKKEKETKPPVQHEFFVTQTLTPPASASLEDITNAAQKVSDNAKYSMGTLSEPLDYYKNSSDGSFYIYGRFYDDSGIACVEVTEKRTHNKNGLEVSNNLETTLYNKNSQNAWFFLDNDGYTDFIIKHTLKKEDGEYNITVNVKDNCQNTTTIQDFKAIKSVLTIRNTDQIELYNISLDSSDASKDYYILEDKSLSWKLYYTKNCIKQNYKQYLRQIKIDKISSSFYKNLDLVDLFKVECSYLNNEAQLMTWNSEKQRYEYTLSDEVDLSELKVNIKIYIKNPDETYSLQFQKDYYFPPLPVLYDDYASNNGKVQLVYVEAGKHIDTIYKFMDTNYQDGVEYMGDVYSEVLRNGYPATLSGVYHARIDIEYSITSGYYRNNNGFIMYKNGGLYSDLTKVSHLIRDYRILEDKKPYKAVLKAQVSESISTETPDYVDITIKPTIISNETDDDMFIVLSNNERYQKFIHIYDSELSPVTIKYPYEERTRNTYFYVGMISKTTHEIIANLGIILTPRTDDFETEVEINPVGFVKYKSNKTPTHLQRDYAGEDAGTYMNFYSLDDAEIVFCPGTIKQALKELSSIKGNIYVQINNSDEICYTTDACLLKKFNGDEWVLTNNSIFIPAWELDREENTITLRYEGTEDSNTASKTFTWEQIDFTKESDYTSLPQESYDYFDPAQNKWINYFKTDSTATSVPANSYIRKSKIILPMNGGLSYYCPIVYEYNGTKSSGTKTDKLIKNGDLYLIASDQPVLMQTYITTTNSYDDCRGWDLEQWQKNHRRIDELVLNFTPETCRSLQYYCPDTSSLKKNTCYVIVARYADGHTQMSEVMQK